MFVVLDELFGDLGATKFNRWFLPFGEHFAYLGAREEDMVCALVWTSLGAPHTFAFETKKCVLKLHWDDAKLIEVDRVKDLLGVVSAIVVTYASMIASNYEVRTAVVTTEDSVEDRLTWSSIAHSSREN